MSDLFHEAVADAFIDRVFAVMALAPQHTFQILTKRAERMREYMTAEDWHERVELQLWEMHTDDTTNALPIRPLKNVWLGVSVENQHFADERIPLLLQTPAAIRFLSLEPLLERVDLTNYLWTIPGARLNGLHWLIVGGESGSGARPFDVAWARWTIAQGRSAGVPVFVKQLGACITGLTLDGPPFSSPPRREGFLVHWTCRENNTFGLCDRKGGDMSEWSEDLRVREFPA